MHIEVKIIGCNSAVYAFNRYPTSQVVTVRNQPYLIDCGEGTQFRLEKFKVKKSHINQIFISHLHGDHYFGLIGLLSSYNLNERKLPLEIYCPKGLKEIVELNFFYAQSQLKFPIHFIEIDDSHSYKIFEDQNIEVHTIPLVHRIPTTGFLFIEKQRERNFIKEKMEEYQIPPHVIGDIKAGSDFTTNDGKIISYLELTTPPPPQKKYAYCSDTSYTESIIPIIQGCDLLYHESTYMHNEIQKAIQYSHSTSLQAAQIAQKANAQQLLLGHFSSRYENLNEMLEEAKTVFPNTLLSEEGKTFVIK